MSRLRRLFRCCVLALALVGSGIVTAVAGEEEGMTLTPQEVARLSEQGAITLVDVREANEFAPEHLEGALFLPLSQITPASFAKLPQDKPIVFYCRSGHRSGLALAQARQAGLTNVRHMQGGILGWKQAGFAHLAATQDNAVPACSAC